MNDMQGGIIRFVTFILLTMITVACQSVVTPEKSPEPLVPTQSEMPTKVVEEQEPTPTEIEVVDVATATPEAAEARTLVICQGAEPEDFHDDTIFSANILQAIFDGPIDENSFGYQPVILEKLPNLADDDASITPVMVGEGDKVVDENGEVVELDASAGITLFPAGGGDPILYEGGQIEMDQLSATFVLLPDLKWSDGAPLTSSDSVYAFNLAANPDTPSGVLLIEYTASYVASDELTITWTGLPGYMDQMYFFNFFDPSPEHIWGKYTPAELIDNEQRNNSPVGWGPYRIEDWIKGDRIILRKNPYYFRAAEGLPVFDTLIYRFVGTDSNANIAALLSGECDILATLSGLDDEMEYVLELHDEKKLNATFTTGTSWSHLDFGIQHSDYDDGYQLGQDRLDFFSDVRVRRAFAMCMDRQAMVDDLFYSQSIVIDTYIPPLHPYYNPEVVHYEFDTAAGGALLDEVGWMDHDSDPATPRVATNVENIMDGTELIVSLEGVDNTLVQQALAILQGSLAECGIQGNVILYPREEFYADGSEGIVFGRNFDLALFAWLTGVEPPCDLYLSNNIPGPPGEAWTSIQDGTERTFGPIGWFGQNNTGFVNIDYDEACNQAFNYLPGHPEHLPAHLEAQRIFAEQLPVVPLTLVNKLAATRPDMCNFIMDPTNNSDFWNIEEFDYGEGCED